MFPSVTKGGWAIPPDDRLYRHERSIESQSSARSVSLNLGMPPPLVRATVSVVQRRVASAA
jgi:hypothetical protein